jgi:hypothetical protein
LPRGGRAFNRYTDHFADALGDLHWTFEGLRGDRWPDLHRSDSRLTFTADERLGLGLLALKPTPKRTRAAAEDLVASVARRWSDITASGLDRRRRELLLQLATRRLSLYPARWRHASRLFESVRPRLLLVEEGAYGYMAVMNVAARQAGVAVAEFQHGMVTQGHDVYNVHPSLAASRPYGLTQPVAFLSYGSWWHGQFNAPIERRVVIGHPHRTESLRGWGPSKTRNAVVILGDGVETENHVAFAGRLAAHAGPATEVLFRPHPRERGVASSIATSVVRLDPEPDLYTSLARANAVVGESSTAMFEAVGLVPRVFAWDTPKSRFYLGNHPFERVGGPDELGDALSRRNGTPTIEDATSIWAADWRARFREFIETFKSEPTASV